MDGFWSCFDSIDGFVQEERTTSNATPESVGINTVSIRSDGCVLVTPHFLSSSAAFNIALYLSTTRLLPFNSTWCFHTEIHPNRISTRASESKQGSANKTKRTCIPTQAKTAITTKTDLVTRLKTWKELDWKIGLKIIRTDSRQRHLIKETQKRSPSPHRQDGKSSWRHAFFPSKPDRRRTQPRGHDVESPKESFLVRGYSRARHT